MSSYDTDRIERILEQPVRIIDIFPCRVPASAPDRYFSVARYFAAPERRQSLYRRFAEILLRLNCYASMAVSRDWTDEWETDPEPASFAEKTAALPDAGYLRVLFPAEEMLIDLDAGDTYLSVYSADTPLWDLLKKMAEAAGFFVWQPPENE